MSSLGTFLKEKETRRTERTQMNFPAKWTKRVALGAMTLGAGGAVMAWAPILPAHGATGGADKIGVAASDVQIINQTQMPSNNPPNPVTLATTTFSTSTVEDLLMSVSSECALYTAVGAAGPGTTTSTATGEVMVWLNLDGKNLPTSGAGSNPNFGGDPNANPPTTGNGPVVFCDRASNLSTAGLTPTQMLTTYDNTRNADAFTWFALDVGNGSHTLKVMADLVSSTSGTGATITYQTPAASAVIGQRTLTVEPTHLSNTASF